MQSRVSTVLLASLLALCISHTTLWSSSRVVVECDNHCWYASLDVARSQVGTREATGRNDGRQVEAYLRSVGLARGNPYCMAGQYWCMWQVTTLPCILRTGHVRSFWNWANRNGSRAPYKPHVGDFMVWGYSRNTSGHIERIESLGRKGWVRTVAFNTTSGTSGNQRDGGGVFYRMRNTVHPLGAMLTLGLVGKA